MFGNCGLKTSLNKNNKSLKRGEIITILGGLAMYIVISAWFPAYCRKKENTFFFVVMSFTDHKQIIASKKRITWNRCCICQPRRYQTQNQCLPVIVSMCLSTSVYIYNISLMSHRHSSEVEYFLFCVFTGSQTTSLQCPTWIPKCNEMRNTEMPISLGFYDRWYNFSVSERCEPIAVLCRGYY